MSDDPLYRQAKALVIDEQRASVSILQRRLSIGYSRASQMIESMEAEKIIGPYKGVNVRAVLVGQPNGK